MSDAFAPREHRHLAALLVALLVLCTPSPAPADTLVMEVVPLRHRLVEDVLPVLTPLVTPGGSVTGLGDKLVIHSTPANLLEIKQVLAGIDTRQHSLRITVRQDVRSADQAQANGLAARIERGDVAAGVGRPQAAPGASLSYGDGRSGVTVESWRTHGRDDSAQTHFVNAIEGRPAFIGTGTTLPMASGSATMTPYGAVVQESLDYRNVGSGVYVTPRLAGDEVTLDISPYADRLDRRGGGAIEQRGLNTQVRGQLGEWIPLGGAGESGQADGGRELYGTARSHASSYDVWVKVELVP